MLKKLFLKFALLLTVFSPFILASTTYADEPTATTSSYGIVSNCDTSFLGLVPWSCGVIIKDDDKGESLKSGIWTIAANIATDITIIAAYLVLGYVIYGGYLYTFSGGDPGKVASGKKTLLNAFLGLGIVMSAYLIMSTIRFALFNGNGDLGSCINVNAESGDITSGCINASALFTNAINWAIGIAGLVSAIFVVYGGISYVTSAGDPGKAAKARQMILYALIGLAIVALASAITAFVSNMIREADKKAALDSNHSNTLIISKGNL